MVKKKTTKRATKKKTNQTMTTFDKKWQAEDDARILASAETIKNDKRRLTLAKTQAKKMAIEQKKEADSLAKIARRD